MTSSCLTFDLRYVLDIQRIQSLGTGHPHVQISGLLYEVHRILFSMKEGKLQEYQINVIQMYKFKLPKIMYIQYFQSLVNEKSKL